MIVDDPAFVPNVNVLPFKSKISVADDSVIAFPPFGAPVKQSTPNWTIPDDLAETI